MRKKRSRIRLLIALILIVIPWQGVARSAPPDGGNVDLRYRVTNPDESYFDVAARMALLGRTDDPMLVQLRDTLPMGVSCRQIKGLPVSDDEIVLPSFHENPKEWKLATEPLTRFERTVSDLSGAWVASGDRYYADCLVDVLAKWGKEKAFAEFQFSPDRPQAWYALESAIFAAALSYSTVTGVIDIAPQRRRTIEAWLADIALRHFRKQSAMRNCCDDHFYRRSLYMTIVGVVTGNNDLFRAGMKAPYVALADLNEQGAFNLAVRRGWRAIHYQNDILLHLVLIMQIAYRQGYDLFTLTVDGRGFPDAVAFLMRSLENPHAAEGLAPGEQDLAFTDDDGYFSWMEVWLQRFENPAMTQLVRHYRPIANHAGGGHMTLFFKEPESPSTAMKQEWRSSEVARQAEEEFGMRYPLLRRWKRSP